jgi:hypothetical protein
VSDLTTKILPRLSQQRIPGLELGDHCIHPNYAGYSVLNIPASICQFFGVPAMAGTPLASEIIDPLGTGIRHVVFILMDSLALHRLQRWIADGSAPVWGELMQDGLLAPLTSITPSTTSAALTSLWTGRSPTQHAITGYEMWMKEYGIVTNTILHTPITYKGDVGGLSRAGFEPEKALPFETLGVHLRRYGIQTYALQHASIAFSGLSKMLFHEVEIKAFYSAADLWINLRNLLEEKHAQRFYAWVYWSEVDHFGHLYGPDDERTAAEFSIFSQAMEKLFLRSPLRTASRGDTLLILTADHGQIATRPNPHYELRNHPKLAGRLHIAPTGENRLTYLHIRPGQVEAVKEYLENTWPGQLVTFPSIQGIEAGLFGPGAPHPALQDRLGDWVIAWQNDAYLWWANKDNPLQGRHGGLHPNEMLTPFLAVRL